MRGPLWLDLRLGRPTGNNVDVIATLARCRNCGQVKVTSTPCGFDHAAALMEFNRARGEVAS